MLYQIIDKINRRIGGVERKFSIQFRKQLKIFRSLDTKQRFTIKDSDLFPILNEATSETGFDAHYTYHPAWAARIVRQINPAKHIDISSILHFSAQLSAFIPTEFYDYRPAKLNLSNLKSASADLCALFFDSESVDCVSCMHTIEHIGLGRYGDPLDPEGDLKAISELKRIVKKGGHLLLVTPVGMPKVQFNAQRIYSYEMIAEQFDGFEIKDFSLVTDSGEFLSPADPALVQKQSYGCGCFWLQKK
jgi:SAM-dependent methyltransferase